MNQELKQRLIGAVVVTSLAAIFIPMIFDDPVDNSGQTVSELAIPAPPVNIVDEPANKVVASSVDVLNKQDTETEATLNAEDGPELAANNEQAFDEPVEDSPAMEPEVASSTTKHENTVSSLNSSINKPIKAIKKIENTEPKQIVPAQSLAVESTSKPVKTSSGLKRWYLQAGTFSKKENALSLIELLHSQGLPTILEPITGPGNTALYRIKVGPTIDKKRASEMKAKLDAQKIQSLMMSE
ncbi:MAG: SPOR domain-containing protein [Methylococcales bacterium]